MVMPLLTAFGRHIPLSRMTIGGPTMHETTKMRQYVHMNEHLEERTQQNLFAREHSIQAVV